MSISNSIENEYLNPMNRSEKSIENNTFQFISKYFGS